MHSVSGLFFFVETGEMCERELSVETRKGRLKFIAGLRVEKEEFRFCPEKKKHGIICRSNWQKQMVQFAKDKSSLFQLFFSRRRPLRAP